MFTALVGSLLGLAASAVEGVGDDAQVAAAAPSAGLGYTPLAAPCRAVDTRAQVAGPVSGAVAPGLFGSRTFQIAGSGITGQGGAAGGCGVPDGAGAVEVSVTVTGATSTGFLRVAPNDGATPSATFINYRSGVGITNTGTVTLSDLQAADLAVFNFAAGTAHVVVDVQGFYDAASPPPTTSTTTTSTTTTTSSSTTTTTSVPATPQAIVAGASSVVVAEGGTRQLSVRLAAQPSGQVTVSASVQNLALATVTPSTLTFTDSNWNVTQELTIAGVQDFNTLNGTTNILLSAPGVTSTTVSVLVVDDDV